MAQQPTSQFDFLYARVNTMLDDAGFADLPEATRDQFLPQFTAEAERRIGVAVMPHLTEESAQKLMDLVENENTTAEDMQAFWESYIPHFQELINTTLNDYAEELKQIASSL